VRQVALLGDQTIVDPATGAVRTRSTHTTTLLAYLVTRHPAAQSRQRIAELFWPDSTGTQALTNLRRELHHLRAALGESPSLVITTRELAWRDTAGCRVDVRTFGIERAAALAALAARDGAGVLSHAAVAVEAYRGDLLPGRDEDWLIEARAELQRQCVELCDLLCRTRTATGDPAGAMSAARRRIALRPLEEAGYQTLMRLQADLGDRAGAVSTYHHCASVLERELGLPPDPSTRQVLRRVLGHPTATGPPATGPTATGPTATGLTVAGPAPGPGDPYSPADAAEPVARRSGVAAAELVGRGRELAVLRAAWQAAVAGAPSMAVVRGDAGVGKTRLIAELAALAGARGAVVAGTECFDASRRLALSPVADWLRHPAIRAATGRLDPVWRTEVERLVPPAAPAGPAEPTTATGPLGSAVADSWQRHRFFEGMARALLSTGRPLLLMLDDLQWCDQETLAFLPFFLGLTGEAPVLVAGTLRDPGDDAAGDGPEPAEWARAVRAGRFTELSLGPLDAAGTGRVAEAITGHPLRPEQAALLQAATGGFPLYVVEAARGALDAADGVARPEADMTAVLRHRLEQLSPPARELAGLAAAVGRNFSLDLLTEAADLDADTVVEAVDELWRRRVVRERPDGYDFTHDLLRDAAYALVSPPRRWLLHRRVAQYLEREHAADTDPVSAALADQYARGGRPERAVGYYRRAAEIATGRFAHADAIRLCRRALSILRTLPDGLGRDRHELAVLETMAAPLNARYGYASTDLQATLERSVRLAESLGRSDAALTAMIGLWATRYVQGSLDEAHRLITRAIAMAEPGTELAGAAHYAYGGSAVSLGMPASALEHFAIGAATCHETPWLTLGNRLDLHCAAWSAHVHWLLGDDRAALAACHDAITGGRAMAGRYNLAVALAYAGITHQLRDDRAALIESVGELAELCRRHGFAYYRDWALVLSGWSRGGEPGIELAQQGIGRLRSDGAFARMPYWLSLLADLQERAGRPDAARATLDAALAAGQARRDLWWLPEVLRRRAAHDTPPAARARLAAAAAMAREHGSRTLLRRCERDLAGLPGLAGEPGPAPAVRAPS
jgi:DNA-binding SARP family transcriptional activator